MKVRLSGDPMRASRLVLTLLLLAPTVAGRTDPSTGRIRILFVGQWYYGGRPQYLLEDPLLMTSVVPYQDFGEQLGEIRRYMHRRYPRTMKQMTEKHDMVIYANIQLPAFTPRQINMVSDSVIGEGLGYMMTGGHTSFGGTTDSYPSWEGTSIEGILPVGLITGTYLKPYYFRLMVSDPGNELMESLPWSRIPPFSYSLNAVSMRQEGHLLAEADVSEGWPILAYGDFGRGRTLAFTTPFLDADIVNYNLREWGYFEDMCANIAYYAAGIALPDDPVMVHELRRLFRSYHDQRLLYLSMVEFIDRFGVSTVMLERELAGIEQTRASSYAAYVSQDFTRSSELMKEVLDAIKEGRGRAVEVKKTALLWVYVAEYIVVTAALMIAGSVLWTLMVKRRLYREMRSTRLIQA